MSATIRSTDISVNVGFPCGAEIPCETMLSLLKTQDACLKSKIPFGMDVIKGSSIVTYARSRVVDSFLKGKASRLFWIDSDIQWEPQDFLRLLMLTTKVDIVCGAYPIKNDKCDLVIKHADLTTFQLHEYGLVKVEGTGLGFCCMTREVVEKVAATKPKVYDSVADTEMADVFRIDTIIDGEGRRAGRGEDMAFFADAMELGYDVWLDPRIQLGHVGSKVYRTDPLRALRLESHFEKVA